MAERGLPASRHLRGDLYEVRSAGDRVAYRVLFATEGARRQVLLALEVFKKKTQETLPATIALAERRLRDWRAWGASQRPLTLDAERTAANPDFPRILEAARERRALIFSSPRRAGR